MCTKIRKSNTHAKNILKEIKKNKKNRVRPYRCKNVSGSTVLKLKNQVKIEFSENFNFVREM